MLSLFAKLLYYIAHANTRFVYIRVRFEVDYIWLFTFGVLTYCLIKKVHDKNHVITVYYLIVKFINGINLLCLLYQRK